MAVTKTHPIKSTLKAAIDYICNPDKTDGKLLVSSFGCTVETADIEFAWTRRHAIDKGTNLGRHLIQAFEPGEVTPEEAHRIGMELAREVLGGKYEFVLTTHIDRDHVHNHLISMRSVSRITGTTTPISGATMRSAAPATEAARSMACPSSSRPGQGQELHRTPGGTERHQLQGEAALRHRPAPARLRRPGGPAPPPSAGRVRTETGQVHLRQGTGPGAVHPIEGPGRRLRRGGPDRPDRRQAQPLPPAEAAHREAQPAHRHPEQYQGPTERRLQALGNHRELEAGGGNA